MTAIGNFEEMHNREQSEVAQLCDRLGYGFVMAEASKLWQQDADKRGFTTAGKVVGPHRGFTEPCQCISQPIACDWCCGCYWLTNKVAELQRRENGSN